MNEWLLIAWAGAFLHGGPAMERFPTREECERVAVVFYEVQKHNSTVFNTPSYKCVEVLPLRREPAGRQ
jgi:hypothetical protein